MRVKKICSLKEESHGETSREQIMCHIMLSRNNNIIEATSCQAVFKVSKQGPFPANALVHFLPGIIRGHRQGECKGGALPYFGADLDIGIMLFQNTFNQG